MVTALIVIDSALKNPAILSLCHPSPVLHKSPLRAVRPLDVDVSLESGTRLIALQGRPVEFRLVQGILNPQTVAELEATYRFLLEKTTEPDVGVFAGLQGMRCVSD